MLSIRSLTSRCRNGITLVSRCRNGITCTSRCRNGITLLFVISMIVLFLLMGTAFVVVSNNFYRSAKLRSQRDLHQIDVQPLLESAFYDIVRGTDPGNTSNPLRGHSILEDMYGYGVTATIDTASVDSSQHFLAVTLNANAFRIIDGQPDPLPQAPGSMTGLVLSFVSGPAKGLSTRVVDHQVSGDGSTGFQHRLILMPHWSGTDLTPGVLAAVGNDRVIVNGRPFSGTGAGRFAPGGSTVPALSAAALQPNQLGRSRDEFFGTTGDPLDGYFSKLGNGGNSIPNSKAPNEPYDTFDTQNMFLAGIRPVGINTVEVIPSFHREQLIADSTKVDLDNVRKNDFRATATAGDSGVNGLLVDNDNDGIEDGIWIDTGSAAISTREGTFIKPLVSYLVLDMGSRANVNAHGSSVALEPNRSASSTDPTQTKRVTAYAELLDNAMVPQDGLVLGQGFGPAEILLSKVMPSQAKRILDLRYGDDKQPGIADYRDDWSGYQLFGLPEGPYGYEAAGTLGGHYGSMLDLHGRYSEGFPATFEDRIKGSTAPVEMIPIAPPSPNDRNSELYDLAGGQKEESVDSPYEFSFSRDPFFGPQQDPDSDDQPFTPRELEALLRRNDADTGMLGQPSRLKDLVPPAEQQEAARLLTTHSHEIQTLYQNLPTRLYGILNNRTALTAPQIRAQLSTMLPSEVLRGLPMNVNRFFGDGVDNNGNGVVDEFGESDAISHPDEKDSSDPSASKVFSFDAQLYRDAFMRQLYVLTLLLTEKGNWFDLDGSGTVDDSDLVAYRKRIAQWVVNVVDFRDADSIMTPFECDLEPWDGWSMDGNLTTSTGAESSQFADSTPHRFVVWGMERPELLITETLATHDTRQQDLDFEVVKTGDTAATKSGGDTDFDSHLMPKVTAFFELYNPWVLTDANQIRPGELYDSNRNGVDLQKTAIGGTPVWRLVVPKIADNELDPDVYGSTQQFDRRIYFTRPKSSENGPEVFYPDISIRAGVVAPGAYAVVGTAGQQADGKYNNYFGRRSSGTATDADPFSDNNLANATRRISMDPTAGELEVTQAVPNGGTVDWSKSTRQITVVPIGLNDGGRQRDLGVSDPAVGYYDLPAADGSVVDIEVEKDGLKFTSNGGLPFAYDEPVDQIVDPGHYNQYIKGHYGITAATTGYRVVHLQRLANPLFPYHADLNPYRTIDSAAIDLFVYNGVEPTVDRKDPIWFSSFERGTATTTNTSGLDTSVTSTFYDRQIELHATGQHRLLFKTDLKGNVDAPDFAKTNENSGFGQNDGHFVSQNLRETLGWYNASFQRSVPFATGSTSADPEPMWDQNQQDPFAWLIWPNRPFVSHLEVMNVPFVSSSQLPHRFGTAFDSRSVYAPEANAAEKELGFEWLSSYYPHLLNFYADAMVNSAGVTQSGPSLHGLMDFLEVPSPFLGTESFVNPTSFEDDAHGISYGLSPPFDRISSYRNPGKVNVNTVLDLRVWNALMSNYGDGALGDKVSYNAWNKSRKGNGTNSEFDNPLRPAYAASFVPPGGLLTSPKATDSGLFRRDAFAFDPPLFDFAPEAADKKRALDGGRAASLRYGMRNRLGNLVTNRSSVFAIWITIGFFEANPDGSLKRTPDGDPAGAIQEMGVEQGEARRGRAFYLVDRSVPVALEPGRNHNVDRIILLKSTIE